MGSLATVGLQKPGNLSIVVLDNECYGETGGQMSHTASAANLVGVAQACGIADARTLDTMAEIETFARTLQDVSAGPRFASVKIDAANLQCVLSNRDGMFILTRLRGSLGFGPI
jgi:thiamine pyrophosphate-dependent acetolactate synthase large subunit-like protein